MSIRALSVWNLHIWLKSNVIYFSFYYAIYWSYWTKKSVRVADNKQLKDYQVAKFTWRIENFTSSNKLKLYSGIFTVNDYRWYACKLLLVLQNPAEMIFFPLHLQEVTPFPKRKSCRTFVSVSRCSWCR